MVQQQIIDNNGPTNVSKIIAENNKKNFFWLANDDEDRTHQGT